MLPEEGSLEKRWIFWVVLVVAIFLLVLLVVWTQRSPIADNLISRELMRRNVSARYDIVQIGLRTQRLENLVLGPKNRPDLTADWVEVDLTVGAFTPRVAAVRAGGVRLRARIVNGELRLGELDKFRDPTSTAPLGLPDLKLGLYDARVRLDTPVGPIGMKLDGTGHLRGGFEGKLAAVMRHAKAQGCWADRLTLYADLSVTAREPRLKGPVRAAAIDCPATGLAAVKPAADIDIRLNESLDHWRGKLGLSSETVSGAAMRLTGAGGDISFDGDARAMKGRVDIAAAAFAHPSLRAGPVGFKGAYSLGSDRRGSFARMQGLAKADGLKLEGSNPVAELRQSAAGTPLAPLAAKFASAVEAAGKSNETTATIAILQRNGSGRMQVTDLAFKSQSGARLDLTGGSGLAWFWPKGQFALDGSLRMEGGGLPQAAIRLKRDRAGALNGQIFMGDYTAANARLALEPVRFVAGRGGSRFTTIVRLDGPLPGGGLKGLSLPVDGRVAPNGMVRINHQCMPVSFTSFKYENLALQRTQLRLCPATGGAMVRAGPDGFAFAALARDVRLGGRLGQSPLSLAAQEARIGVPDKGFSANSLKVVLGSEAPTILDLAHLTGRFAPAGLKGGFEGGAGHIGNVPLEMSDASGRWSFAKGALKLDGDLRLADRAAPDRFNPLLSKDFVMTLANNRISANGILLEPRTGAPVTKVGIAHNLGTGAGQADLAVDSLQFNDSLQPEDITRIALGVVANVKGAISGEGQIRWDGRGVTSEGRFRTNDVSLAAAFGPVTGLSGEIHFSDLLGLQTPPGQIFRIASVNPGIEATDGIIRYQLLPGQQVRIEGGTWPFSGGQLTLEPTVLDFSAEKPRNLTFRIIGLQAAEFINKLELENISATGTFDGLLPMVFDASGGRIVGGVLVARQEGLPPLYVDDVKQLKVACDNRRQGGTLAYVGEVSNADLGMFGKLAFDALKSLRYKCLTILMDGYIDGEVITQVAFNGVNQAPVESEQMGLGRQFTGLPFIFNIRIEAPFRGLLNTAKSFVDPTVLIRSHVANGLAVQPADSDTMRTGNK